MVALGRVVVDDVQDHLDPGLVEDLHHLLELAHLLAADALARVARVRREEADRVVPPVVREPAVDEMTVAHEVVHGHQLDGGHAEAREVLEGGRRGQPGVGSPQFFRDRGVSDREPPDVHLVDHGQVPRGAKQPVVAPRERGVHDDALGHEGRAVPIVLDQVGVGIAHAVAEDRVAPLDGPGDRLGVGIEEQLPGVEAVPGGRLVRAVDAVPVEEPGSALRKVDVPDLIGALHHRHAVDFAGGIGGIEDA